MHEESYDGIIEVELGKSGLFAWISEADRELLNHSWCAKKAGTAKNPHYYAYRQWHAGSARGDVYLHNEVWESASGHALPKGFLVDHINGDKLDNRRDNLRLATRGDNEANKQKRRTQSGGAPSSKYKGVSKIKDGRKKCWRVIITYEKKQHQLGSFCTEAEAAEVYNKAALEYYGEFALLNEIEEET